jgi:hypothetical protein
VIRRSLIVACALVGAISLSSCATFSDNDAVARVGDVELSRDRLELFVHDLLSAGGEVPDQASGDAYRQVIGGWVVEELIRQKLVDDGIEATDEDRAAADASVQTDLGSLPTAPSDVVHDFVYESALARATFTRTQQQGALGEFAKSATIVIDPRYGYWDGASGTILPMQP